MPVQITITGENAAQAIEEFATLTTSFTGAVPSAPTPEAVPSINVPVTAPSFTASPAAPVAPAAQPQAAAVPTAPAPVPTAPQAPSTVPTTAPTYTMEQLGVAAGPIVDAGRGPELTAWLQQHGAQALTQLPKEMYGEFATYLRSLGARI
ncbi:hypothetical protein PAALTS15_10000 [Paenibacillus alvei TS-15]|uniref:Uncharacterized protein n=1 Tax=Paenibacillus alvei TS-15 TaxID=1117108 RepID=S9SRY0_PAEAL|nr:hypothetical protein [Paenibacillus alvei]EPY07449.1 hypothetical protein PAALTS15_10000 [Paenibacillus alvei TS-15]